MIVRRRSLMLDTLAFSKGDIFILIVFAAKHNKYLYTQLKRLTESKR